MSHTTEKVDVAQESRPVAEGSAEQVGTLSNSLSTSRCGDSGLRIIATDDDPERRWQRIHRIAEIINCDPPKGVISVVATYSSALVEFDPFTVDHNEVKREICRVASSLVLQPPNNGAVFTLPVVYGGSWGPDLGDVAADLGIAQDDLVARHAGPAHVVRCLSHSAAPMLDGPDLPAEVSRLATPRVRVPGGSVMVAGRQAMVLSREQPSGWKIIGWTPVRMVDPSRNNPTVYTPGDEFRYRRVSVQEADSLTGMTIDDCRG